MLRIRLKINRLFLLTFSREFGIKSYCGLTPAVLVVESVILKKPIPTTQGDRVLMGRKRLYL